MKILFLCIWAEWPSNRPYLDTEEHEIWYVCDPNGLRYVKNYLAPDEIAGLTLPTSDDPRELMRMLQDVHRQFPFERVVAVDERTVLPAAYIREAFNIPGPRPAEVDAFRSKRTMKQWLAPRGVRVIRDLDRAELDAGPFVPCVIKCPDGTASGGVHLCHARADYEAHRHELDNGAMLEEFVEGDIFHIDGAYNADGVVAVPHAYLNTCFDHYVLGLPVGSIGVDEPVLKQRLVTFAEQVIAALPLREGVYHMEVIRTPQDELVFLEIGGRVGGGEVYRNFTDVYNFDLLEFHIASQLGQSPKLRKIRENTVGGWLMINSVAHVPGVFTGIRYEPLAEDNCAYSLYHPRLGHAYDLRERMSMKYSFRADTSAQVRASVIELMEKVGMDSVPLPAAAATAAPELDAVA
ncbi:ATP-grasp domain-containing protein [Tahibacter caeni]|uniref:ATP-grasp domain-containing protein n=1 Tax=Tahibacter caeni TaxID=1453545 RepID=UPI002148DC65|nr:hypothetical protein [Tahibacter caeni]